MVGGSVTRRDDHQYWLSASINLEAVKVPHATPQGTVDTTGDHPVVGEFREGCHIERTRRLAGRSLLLKEAYSRHGVGLGRPECGKADGINAEESICAWLPM